MRARLCLIPVMFVALGGGANARADRPLHEFSAVALAPDGAHIADVETDRDQGGGLSTPPLVIRDTATGKPVIVDLPCGHGPECAPGAPAWSPDGRRIAFTVRIPGGHARAIYAVAADGGAPTKLASFDGTVITLRYARDGRLAALAIADADKEVGADAAGAIVGGADGGAIHEQRIALVEDGALRFISPPDLFVYEYDFLPGDAGFVGTAAPGDGDAHWWRAKLYQFESPRAEPRLLYAPTDPQLQLAQPRVSPDGKTVAFIGGLMSDFDNPGGDVFILPLDHESPPVDLTEGWRATATSIAWNCGSDRLIAGALAGGGSELADIDARGKIPPRALWSGDATISGGDGAIAFSCHVPLTATVRESFTAPPEIFAGPIGAWRAITTDNDGVTAPPRARRVPWTNDGQSGSDWLLLPDGPAPRNGYPLIVAPHGGPAWSYAPSFLGPSFLRGLLDHGYALLLPNPRGGFGQGEAFTRANTRDFGGGDFSDILAGLDAAMRAEKIDPERLGITGVSYGGFMTMWAVTHTHRFKAAVARAGISNWVSYYGENGIGDWLIPYFGVSLYDDPAPYRRASPIDFVKGMNTPTLMFVGSGDIECPPPQSQEFWHALDELGVATGMVVYPGEGHAILQPAHAADQMARAIAWFDRYLR